MLDFLDGGLRQPSGESLPIDLIRRSVEDAFLLWASFAPLHFVEVEDEGGPVPSGSGSYYPDGQYGQIRFHHRYINGPDVEGQQPKAKADRPPKQLA